MDSRYGYMYGSAAPKLPEQPNQEKQQVHRKPPVRKKAIQPEPEAISIAPMVFCIVIGFAILFTMIYRFGAITEMNIALSELSEDYEEIKDNNRKLQAEIGASINQENIRRIAEERLNMKMPDSYQRIPVKVPRANYSMIAENTAEKDNSIFKSIFMIFSKE